MPAWLFILVLAVLVLFANIALWAFGLWCVGKLMRARGVAARRLLLVCTLVVLLDFALVGALILAGQNPQDPKSLPLAIAMLAYAVGSRVWVAGRLLGRRIPGAIVAAIGALVLQLALLLALMIPVRRTLIDAFRIPTASMAPTLPEGGKFLVDRTATPRRWDIMMYRTPGPEQVYWAKRVVGMPGERIEILQDRILINGVETPLPPELRGADFIIKPGPGSPAWIPPLNSPVTLGPDEYYVVGDNTQRSVDSRYGAVPAEPGRTPGVVPASNVAGVIRLLYRPTLRLFR